MRATLGQAKASTIAKAIGIAACDPRFTQYLNESQQRLMNKGRWNNTVERMRVCVIEGCITWPRGVKTIEGVSVCQYGIPIRNQWFEFQTNMVGPNLKCFEKCEQTQLLPRNNVCQFRDFDAPSYIRIYPETSTDNGKYIVFKGQDGNRVPVRTEVDGEWITGEAVAIDSPFATTTTAFYPRLLDGVVKPITNGRLQIYAVNQVTSEETLIAIYEPSETVPSYLRTYMLNRPRRCSENDVVDTTNCCTPCAPQGDGCNLPDLDCAGTSVEALVRLEFIPALVDSDFLMIPNIEALKHAMKAIINEERGQYAEGAQEMQLAVQCLREERNATFPVQTVVVTALPNGTARMSYPLAGFI